MLDMARVYGTLANSGKMEDLTPFIRITDQNGNSLTLPKSNATGEATSPEIAFILTDILSDNLARSPAFGLSSALYLPGYKIAVKTGTSDNKRDNWTIGYTPDYTVTVWVGNNDNSPMNPQLTSGVTGAAPVWQKIMRLLTSKYQASSLFTVPENITVVSCSGRNEYFIKGTVPSSPCLKETSPTPESAP